MYKYFNLFLLIIIFLQIYYLLRFEIFTRKMAAQLTRNFIEALYRNEYQDFENPVVQVLNVKTTKSNTHR